jgi:hypothetical protein
MDENDFSKVVEEALLDEYLALIPQQAEEHIFSKKFEKKMSRLIKKQIVPHYHYKNVKTFKRRVACIVAILVFLSTITAINADTLKEKVYNFFITTFPKFSVIQYDIQNECYPDTIQQEYTFTYDLSDYTIDYEYKDDTIKMVTYIKGDVTIDFSQNTKKDYDVCYNTEDALIENITINNWNGIYFKDNHNCNSIILDVDDYIITVCSNVSKQQLIDIVKTLSPIQE